MKIPASLSIQGDACHPCLCPNPLNQSLSAENSKGGRERREEPLIPPTRWNERFFVFSL